MFTSTVAAKALGLSKQMLLHVRNYQVEGARIQPTCPDERPALWSRFDLHRLAIVEAVRRGGAPQSPERRFELYAELGRHHREITQAAMGRPFYLVFDAFSAHVVERIEDAVVTDPGRGRLVRDGDPFILVGPLGFFVALHVVIHELEQRLRHIGDASD